MTERPEWGYAEAWVGKFQTQPLPGRTLYLPLVNLEQYEKKGYILLERTFVWEDWAAYAAGVEQHRGVGDDAGAPVLYPGPLG